MSRLDEVQRALGANITVHALIGTGGFAEVYSATDNRLGRDIAVKVLRPDISAHNARERFVREARAAAQVRHPNVLAIFDVSEGDGLPWFTMPLVRGESLRARLERERKLSPSEAARILRGAAAGLHAAHRAGLVHRDVKPDNILLDGPEADVLIADFGVAAALVPDDERLTTEGMLVGTPRYMSPEQASGESVIDARSDIYALGVVAFEMIAGEPPFSAPNASALLAKHLTAPIPSLRAFAPDCPATLAVAVEQCLAKEPAERWPTADAVRQAVEGRMSRASVPAAGSSAAVRDSRPPLRAIVVASVFLAASVGTDVALGRVQATPFAAFAIAVALAVWFGGRVTAGLHVGAAGQVTDLDRQLKRARALRTAGRALLSGMPRSFVSQLGPVASALDGMLFEVQSAATRLDARGTPARGRTTTSANVARDDLRRALSELEELHNALERTFGEAPEQSVAAVRTMAERFSAERSRSAG